MTGSDNNRAAGFFINYTEADYRGRSRFGYEINFYAVTGKYLGASGREIFRSEARIITNNNALLTQTGLIKIICSCLGTDPYVLESEIFGDYCPPSISTEFNRIIYIN